MADRRLSLDHISVTDTTPWQLVELAAETGCAGVCPFLHSMAVLPAMPEYDLVRDAGARAKTRAALAATGVTVDLIYPFTLAGRTVVADFAPALEAGAELGAPLANVLCYDRDPVRRREKLAELATLAASFDIALAIEFYPPSQLRTLGETIEEIGQIGRDDIGITLDLLHVMRGGDAAASLQQLAHPLIRIAQIADGPAAIGADRLEWEAGIQRMLPGEGVFDIAGFLAALAPEISLSVETPQQSGIDSGLTPIERTRAAVEAMRRFL